MMIIIIAGVVFTEHVKVIKTCLTSFIARTGNAESKAIRRHRRRRCLGCLDSVWSVSLCVSQSQSRYNVAVKAYTYAYAYIILLVDSSTQLYSIYVKTREKYWESLQWYYWDAKLFARDHIKCYNLWIFVRV